MALQIIFEELTFGKDRPWPELQRYSDKCSLRRRSCFGQVKWRIILVLEGWNLHVASQGICRGLLASTNAVIASRLRLVE